MANVDRIISGLKAGLAVSILLGSIVVATAYFVLTYMRDEIIAWISADPARPNPLAEQIYNTALVIGPISIFVGCIFGGLILGAIYGLVYEKIPRKNIYKALIFGIVIGLIFNLPLLFIVHSLTIYLMINMAINFLFAIAFSVLLDFFFRRFAPSPLHHVAPQSEGISPLTRQVMLAILLLGVIALFLPWLNASVIIGGYDRSTLNYGYHYIIPLNTRYAAPTAIANVLGFMLFAYSFKKPQKARSLSILAGTLVIVGVIASFSYTYSATLAEITGATYHSISGRLDYGMGLEALSGFLMIMAGLYKS